MKVSIIYWSGTGNTEAMASAIKDGVEAAGGEALLLPVAEADAGALDSDVIFFGCPAMGCEELEENEFAPYFTAVESKLKGKKVGLFGSYGWGDGEWMRNWQSLVEEDGAVMIADGLIANNAPDGVVLAECMELGKKAVNG